MSIPASLKREATHAYRDLLRTCAHTFRGDAHAILTTRAKFRDTFEKQRGETDADKYSEGVQMFRDVARLLRENVVQGKWDDQRGAYGIRITQHTELGNNHSIKSPKPAPSLDEIRATKSRRRRAPEASAGAGDA